MNPNDVLEWGDVVSKLLSYTTTWLVGLGTVATTWIAIWWKIRNFKKKSEEEQAELKKVAEKEDKEEKQKTYNLIKEALDTATLEILELHSSKRKMSEEFTKEKMKLQEDVLSKDKTINEILSVCTNKCELIIKQQNEE